MTQNQDRNKMDSTNLGLLFGAHLMCPRKMTTEELQSSHQLLTVAVAFMIDHAPRLFDTSKPPPQLLKDITGNRTPSNFNVNRASESISSENFAIGGGYA